MSHINNQNILDYLKAIRGKDTLIIEQIRRYALDNNVPIIKDEMKDFLQVIIAAVKPVKILEIGTAIGYSSIIMSNSSESVKQIITLEKSEEMIKIAGKNITNAEKNSIIKICIGDAEKTLEELEGQFDLIFMDAAKGQYITFLPHCLRLLKKGGILISDNVLQDGYIAKSRWSIPRRQRTIHRRMRQYLWELNHNSALKTAILPIADGITISYKTEEDNTDE